MFSIPLSPLLVVYLFFLYAYGAPASLSVYTVRRQVSMAPPQTITVTKQIPTQAATLTEVCTFVTTPITGANGESLIQIERSCTITDDSGASSSILTTLTSTPSPGPSQSVSLSLGDFSGLLTSVTTLQSSSSSANPSAFTSPASNTNLPSIGSSSLLSLTTATPSGAAIAATTTTNFDPPGKSLQVLPIGLGVFAGVSLIAIIIVGMVTWERRKHRRNFRRQKLAENGAQMGYGGVEGGP